MHFIYFLGRFHILVLHLPIGLIFAVVSFEWLVSREKFRYLEPAAPLLWGATAITAVITTVLGYMHFAEGGFQTTVGHYHRLFGTLVAVIAIAGWLLRSKVRPFKGLYLYVSALLLIVVTVAGHTGGSLTHGSRYLMEYAPQPLRLLVGLPPIRTKVVDLALADPYLDIVQPIFIARCSGCHGDELRRNELSLATYDMVMKGGKSGPAIVPGNPAGSELFRRISLPKDSKDFMPSEGKTPLTDSEVKILGWWIQAGAPTGVVMAKLSVPSEIKPLLDTSLRMGVAPAAPALSGITSASTVPASAETTASAAPPVPHPADPALIGSLSSVGFSVRQVSLDNPLLIVSQASPGGGITDAAVQALLSAPDQIVELDLRRSGLQDSNLRPIGQLIKLTHLHIEGNQISDDGVRQLANLKSLTYLNLYDNHGITNASIDTLSKMPALQRVFLWNTQVTDNGAKELRKKKSSLEVDLGLSVPELSISDPSHETAITQQGAH